MEASPSGHPGGSRRWKPSSLVPWVDSSIKSTASEVGFLPASDPRIPGTVAAVERDLVRDGLVDHYRTESGVDGLPAGEGAFLLWLLAIRNDVGLLAEEQRGKPGAVRAEA